MGKYKTITVAGVQYLLHRYVWEQANGKVPAGLVIHHKNGDRLDNRIENLEALTHQEHAAHHNQKHPLTQACVVCANVFTPHPTKRSRAKTCSRECLRSLLRKLVTERSADPKHIEKLRQAAFRNGSAERGKTLVLRRWARHDNP